MPRPPAARLRWLASWAAVVGTLAVMPAAGPGAQPAAADRPVPFPVGEALTFDVSYAAVPVGAVTLSVSGRRATPTGAAYTLAGEARPAWLFEKVYPLHYKATALLDTRTLLPLEASLTSEERGRRRVKTTRFRSGEATIDYEVRTAAVQTESRAALPESRDPLSALYVLRTLPLRAGAKVTLPITSDGRPYRVVADVGGPEPMRTVIGVVRAWRLTLTILDGQGAPATTRRIMLWLTDDARRVPVRLEAGLAVGSFVLTLADLRG